MPEPDITLRPLRESDAEELARLADNRKIWDNVRDFFPHPYTERDARIFIKSKLEEDPLPVFGIEYQGELTGVIGVVRQQDIYRYSAEVGYWIGEDYWGMGLATAALRRMTGYAFQTFSLEKLYAGVFAHNTASIRVLEKVGYRLECISLRAAYKNEQFLDEHRYFMLRSQWVNSPEQEPPSG